MSLHRPSILGFATNPDTTGNVWWEPTGIALNAAGNNRYSAGAFVFKDTGTRDKLNVRFRVPKNFVSAPKLGLVWACVPTSGNSLWKFAYKSVADGESADPSSDDEDASAGSVAAPGTARLQEETLITLTAANFAVDDLVHGAISRDGANESSGIAGNLYLLDAFFEYSDA